MHQSSFSTFLACIIAWFMTLCDAIIIPRVCVCVCVCTCMSDCCSAMGCLCSGVTSECAPSECAPSECAPSEGAPSEGVPRKGAPSECAPREGAPRECAPSEASDEVGGCRRTLLAGGGERIEGLTIVDMVRGATGVRPTPLRDYRKG